MARLTNTGAVKTVARGCECLLQPLLTDPNYVDCLPAAILQLLFENPRLLKFPQGYLYSMDQPWVATQIDHALAMLKSIPQFINHTPLARLAADKPLLR